MKQKLRLSLVLMVFVYFWLNFLLYTTSSFTAGWAIWAKTLPVVPLVVLGIVFVIQPFIHKNFGKWINS